MSLKYDYSGFHARAKRNLPIFPEFRFPKNVHSPISQADRQNALPVPRPIAPQDLEPRLRPESGILCFNRSISGGFVT